MLTQGIASLEHFDAKPLFLIVPNNLKKHKGLLESNALKNN
jgi:hypothetical protein